MADLINASDPLNQGRVKINKAIEQSERAEGKSDKAVEDSAVAKTTAELVQTQFDEVAGEGTIDPAVEQMKVDSNGVVHSSPDARLRFEYGKTIAQLAQIEQELNNRVSETIANAGDGTIPTELVDIRTIKNRTHTVAGDALRSLSDGVGVNKLAEGENLYNYVSDFIPDFYIQTTGIVSPAVGWGYAKIPVKENTEYNIWLSTGDYSGRIGGISFRDKDFISTGVVYDPPSTQLGYLYKGVKTLKLLTPTNTNFILVTVLRPTTTSSPFDNRYTFKLFKGDGNNPKITSIYGLPIHDEKAQSDIATLKAQSGKNYEGVKWGVVGDSLTEKNIRSTKFYHEYISDELGLTVTNLGKSGTGYKRTDDTGNAFYQRILNVPTELDVITMFGSFNDLGSGAPLGTASDTGTTTIGGAINTTIDNLYSILPTIPLGIISPTPWQSSRPADENNSATKYARLLETICKNRGIPFLNLYFSSGLRPWDAEYRTLMYSRDDGNGTHPDENGHKLIAAQIREFVKSLI